MILDVDALNNLSISVKEYIGIEASYLRIV